MQQQIKNITFRCRESGTDALVDSKILVTQGGVDITEGDLTLGNGSSGTLTVGAQLH